MSVSVRACLHACMYVTCGDFMGSSDSCKKDFDEMIDVSIISIWKAFIKPQGNGRSTNIQPLWPYSLGIYVFSVAKYFGYHLDITKD